MKKLAFKLGWMTILIPYYSALKCFKVPTFSIPIKFEHPICYN